MNSGVGYPEEPYTYTELHSKQPQYCSRCGALLEGDRNNKNPQYDIYTGRLLNTAILSCPVSDNHDKWRREGLVWERYGLGT